MSKLLERAKTASETSYSPYSKFPVGAAVEMASGNIYTGANIENSSFGLSICAERVAIFNAISNGEMKISAIAIACPDLDDRKSSKMPCGACRQVISEFSDESTQVIIKGIGTFKMSELLPDPFSVK